MPQTNSVIDLSHHNRIVDLTKAAQAGILGVIHKASQAFSYVDPNFVSNRGKAEQAGLLWGAYHFGTGGDGVAQAEHFLKVVKPTSKTLLVLDLEANAQGTSMALEEARAFSIHVHEKTGKWPGLYSGNYIKELLGTKQDPVLASS